MTRRNSAAAAAALVLALALAGCGGGDEGSGNGTPGPTGATSTGSTPSGSTAPTVDATSATSAYGVDVPAGLSLSAPGSQLRFGDAASVAWAIDEKGLVGALKIKILDVRRGTIKDFAGFTLGDQAKASTPYYVDAAVLNIGRTDLSGVAAPLWVVDATNTLLGPNTFGGTFAACHPNVLPQKFTTGKLTRICMVYLAGNHGHFTAVSFRPTQEFNPITWTGPVTPPKPAAKKKR